MLLAFCGWWGGKIVPCLATAHRRSYLGTILYVLSSAFSPLPFSFLSLKDVQVKLGENLLLRYLSANVFGALSI